MNKFLILITSVVTLSGCGFHLRGISGDYKLPFATVYLDCNNIVICPNLQTAIKTQSLAKLVSSPNMPINKKNDLKNTTNAKEEIQGPITTIRLVNEQTSRDPQNFNSVGRIAAYILTYQVQAQVWQYGSQIGDTINVSAQSVMQYNDSIILANNLDEATFWDKLHQSATNQLIRRLVAFKTNSLNR